MENNTFKSVAFGGFAKQDVINYIEEAAREAAAQQERLEQENESLRTQIQDLTAQLEQAQGKVQELNARREELEKALEQETSVRTALEPFKSEAEQLSQKNARLEKELQALRPDAEAYAQFREQIGAIECEARKRAADLESETVSRLERITADFRRKYQDLMTTFDATATHVTGELRKVEVNLTQLPRAMDQAGKELEALAAELERQNSRIEVRAVRIIGTAVFPILSV